MEELYQGKSCIMLEVCSCACWIKEEVYNGSDSWIMEELYSRVYSGSRRKYIMEVVGSWSKYILKFIVDHGESILWSVCCIKKEVYSEVYVGSWRKYTLECMVYQEGSILLSVSCIMKEV